MTNQSKAKKHSSKILTELLSEISPLEMKKTKEKMMLAARIEDLVNEKGWTKSQFAKKMGKNPSEITKWYSGTQNFTTEILTHISFVLEVNVADLFCMKHQQVIDRKSIVQSGSNALFLSVSTPMRDDLKISRIYSTSTWTSASTSIKSQMN